MARKLNKKFIVVLSGVALATGGGVFTAYTFMRPSIEALEKKGDAALAEGDYQTASDSYGRAAARAKTDVNLQLKFVDAFEFLVRGDRERFESLRQYYAGILQTDPRSVPALLRMLRIQEAYVRGLPSDRPRVRSLIDTAERILSIQPLEKAAEREARRALVTATLEPFSRNLEVSPDEVDKQREAAERLFAEDPKDGAALMMVARFHLDAAQQAARNGNAAAMTSSLDACRDFLDGVLKADPENADAHFARYNLYRAYAVLTPGIDRAKRNDLGTIASEALTQADKFAKFGEDDRFLDIRMTALRLLELRDPKLAEERYQQLIAELPSDRRPRVMLASFLSKQPARRADAIKVLETPFEPKTPLKAMDSLQQVFVGLQEQARLCVLRLQLLEGVTDPKEREDQMKRVEQDLATLNSTPDAVNSLQPWLLRIEAGLAMEKGRISDAIERLDSALKLLDPGAPSTDQEVRNDVLYDYANAHLRLGQTGKARQPLKELVERRPEYLIARARLADLLITERNYNEASKQIEILRQVLPNNPLVETMNVRLLSLRTDQLRDNYKTMPESTRDQRLLKAQAASTLGDSDEVIRLAREMVKSDPRDVEASLALAQTLARKGERDEATAVIQTAMRSMPDNAQLKSAIATLAAETPEQRRDLVQQRIEDIADPYVRKLAQSEVLRSEGKLDEALAVLKDAEKEKPTDARALDAQFSLLLGQKNFTEAEAVVGRLTALNGDQAGAELKRITLLISRAQSQENAADRERLQSEALSRASKAAQQYREIAAASLLYAQLLHQAQSYNEAIEQYDQTLDKLPTNIDALRGAVQCLIATDRIPAARRRLDEGLAIAPNDPSLQQISMNLEISQGDPAKAIEALEKNVQANPDNLAAWAQLGTGLEQAASNKASKNEVDAAKAFLQRAADHWAKASEKFPTDLRFASATADVQRRLGNPRAAEEIFEKLAASDVWKDKPDVTRELASQYVRSGKPDQAEQVLQAYLERDKTLPTPVLLQLSVLYAQQQRADAALALLALKPDDPAVQRYRIELLVAANDLPTARVAIEEALAKNPTPEIQLIAAFVELRSSRFEQADGFISAVLKVRPNDAAALFYRSQVRLNLNPPQVEGAKEDLRRVSELTPNNIEARLSLAELLLQSNDREGAIRELERAWAVNNANKLVFLRLMDAYAGASPPRLADQQQVLNQAKASPQLAADADVLLVEANLTLARGDTRRAQEQAKAFKAAGANNPGVKERYYDLLLRAKAYRDLLAESEADLKDDRGAWQIYRLRGIAYRRQDQRLEAQREFDAAYNLVSAAGNWQGVALVVNTIAQELGVKLAISKVEPLAKSDLEARMLLTSLYERDNNLPAALAQVERTLADRPRLDPRQLDSALQAAGSLYLRMNPPMSEKARQVYEELSQRYPDDLALLNNLASVMGMPGSGGTPQKAVEYSTKAYDLSLKLPEGTLTPYIWDTHGWLLVQTGKVSEGIDLLRKAADTAKFPDAHLHLAEALMLQKDFDGAAQALEQAGQLADTMARENKPLDPSIRPKLERLTAELEAKRGTASVVN